MRVICSCKLFSLWINFQSFLRILNIGSLSFNFSNQNALCVGHMRLWHTIFTISRSDDGWREESMSCGVLGDAGSTNNSFSRESISSFWKKSNTWSLNTASVPAVFSVSHNQHTKILFSRINSISLFRVENQSLFTRSDWKKRRNLNSISESYQINCCSHNCLPRIYLTISPIKHFHRHRAL